MKVRIFKVMKGAFSGKTLARILFNESLSNHSRGLSGRVLDLAGGMNPSYLSILPKNLEVVRTNRSGATDVKAVDINKLLPFVDSSFDSVFLFNALYIVEEPKVFASEVERVLKRGGKWFVSSPFIANEMAEPHDYLRFTAEGLERLARHAGFDDVQIERLGDRASSATHLMHPFFVFSFVRAFIFPLAVLLDSLIPRRVRKVHPAPISYFMVATKNHE
jgi:SAM-dependent methyltransferase